MAADEQNGAEALEHATQKRLKECLDPLRKQGENMLGCLGALVMIALLVGVLSMFDLGGWVLGGVSTILGLGVLVTWSTWDDRQKRKATDLCVERFDLAFPLGDPTRELAITILRTMGGQEKHSYNKAANQVLVEIGEEALPDKPAEQELGNALRQLNGAAPEAPAPPPPKPPGAAAGPAPSPPQTPGADKGTRRRPRFIPLEPEERK